MTEHTNIKDAISSISPKRVAKLALHAVNIMSGVKIGKRIAAATDNITGFAAGAAITACMMDSSNRFVDMVAQAAENVKASKEAEGVIGNEPAPEAVPEA